MCASSCLFNTSGSCCSSGSVIDIIIMAMGRMKSKSCNLFPDTVFNANGKSQTFSDDLFVWWFAMELSLSLLLLRPPPFESFRRFRDDVKALPEALDVWLVFSLSSCWCFFCCCCWDDTWFGFPVCWVVHHHIRAIDPIVHSILYNEWNNRHFYHPPMDEFF